MSVINEGIRLEDNNTLSFGNYEVKEKLKVIDFKVGEDLYKVRTHNEVTRLSKNSKLLLETIPGSTIHNLSFTDKNISFLAEGKESTLITLELEANSTYSIFINDVNIDKIKSNLSGKVSFSIELNQKPQTILLEKI